MIFLIRLLLLRDLRVFYPSKLSVIGEAFSIVAGLSIYWLTSRALSPNLSPDLEWHGMDYFSFVVLGELALALPSQIFANSIRVANSMVTQKITDSVLMIPGGLGRFYTVSLISSLSRNLLSLSMTLLFALVIFDMQLSASSLLILFFTLLIGFPVFWGMGALAFSVLLKFGRGQGLLNQMNFALSILAGAYFPINVFPDSVATFLTYGSPFTTLLQAIRKGVSLSDPSLYIALVLWGVVLFPLGLLALRTVESSLRSGQYRSFVLR